MKNKILTTISTIMLFVPWTILPLRMFDWALESPVAEIIISCYAAFMIFSGVLQSYHMDFYNGQNGTQAGNPKKAAELYIKVAEMDNPPESLPMGTDSCNGIREIALNTVQLMDEIQDTASYTDF